MAMKRHCDFCNREVGYLQADMNIRVNSGPVGEYPGNWMERDGLVQWDLCDHCAEEIMEVLWELARKNTIYDKEN